MKIFLEKSYNNQHNIIIFIAVAMLYFGVIYNLGMNYSLDDTYISFRYINNFINNEGLVYNINEYTEGYSNLLFVLFVSLIHKLTSLSLEVSSYLILLFSQTITLIMTYLISRKYMNRYFSLIPVLLLIFSSSYMYWVTNGLETHFNIMLLMIIMYFINYEDRYKNSAIYILIFSLLFIMTRPENVFLVLSIYVVLIMYDYSSKNYNNLKSFLLLVIIVGSLFYIRYQYYGHLLPNTVSAKSYYMTLLKNGDINIQEFIYQLFTTAMPYDYMKKFISMHGGALLVFGLTGALLLFKKNNKMIIISFGIILFYSLLLLQARWDWMPYNRFLIILLPLLFIYFSYILYYLYKKNCILVLISISIIFLLQFDYSLKFSGNSFAVKNSLDSKVGKDLNAYLEQNKNFKLGTIKAGRIAYEFNGYVLDIFGLTDEYIAHHGRPRLTGKNVGGKEDKNYVIKQNLDGLYFNNICYANNFFKKQRQFLLNYNLLVFDKKHILFLKKIYDPNKTTTKHELYPNVSSYLEERCN